MASAWLKESQGSLRLGDTRGRREPRRVLCRQTRVMVRRFVGVGWSLNIGRHARALFLPVTAGALILGVGCGGNGDEAPTGGSVAQPSTAVTSVSTATSSTSDPTTALATGAGTEPASERLEGVTVANGQTMEPPYPWWWVVDLAGGATIEGSGRVLVEVPQGEVGCGEAHHRIGAFQIEQGETVSFELVEGPGGKQPGSGCRPEPVRSPPSRPCRLASSAWPARRVPRTRPAELAAQRALWERTGPATYKLAMSWHVFRRHLRRLLDSGRRRPTHGGPPWRRDAPRSTPSRGRTAPNDRRAVRPTCSERSPPTASSPRTTRHGDTRLRSRLTRCSNGIDDELEVARQLAHTRRRARFPAGTPAADWPTHRGDTGRLLSAVT